MRSPISAVIWVTDDILSSTINDIKKAKFPSRLVLHLVIAYGSDYPINYLRNTGIPEIPLILHIAIDAVATSHFFIADMDVWPVGIALRSRFTRRRRLQSGHFHPKYAAGP